jgi:serine protease Do
LPSGPAVLAVTDDLTAAVEPIGSGGLLAALSVWRRLVVEGPEKFGDLTYFGTFTMPGAPTTFDVLLGRHAGVTCRYFFDSTTGDLVAVEMQPAEEFDPCELVFADYREQGGRWLPSRIEVRHGDEAYAVIAPREWNFAAEVKP